MEYIRQKNITDNIFFFPSLLLTVSLKARHPIKPVLIFYDSEQSLSR